MTTFRPIYEKHLYSRRLVPRSVDYILTRIACFERWMLREKKRDDPRDVTLQDLLDFHVMLRQRRRVATGEPVTAGYCHSHLYALRGYYRFLHQIGRVLVDPGAALPALKSPKPLPKGVLTADQALRLLQQPQVRTLFGFRDRCILELLYSTGLRGLEVCRLTIYDVDLAERTVTVRRGKGGKDRIVPLGKAATHYLREYLGSVRPKMMAVKSSPAAVDQLFFSQQRRPLSPSLLYYMIGQNRRRAGLSRQVGTHSLRHTCATEMLRGGASVRHVQEMLGHSQISTTQIYTRVVPVDLQKVHQKTSPSERRKKTDVAAFQRTGWGAEKRRRKRYVKWPRRAYQAAPKKSG
jgi:integrase/recombinase XerD